MGVDVNTLALIDSDTFNGDTAIVDHTGNYLLSAQLNSPAHSTVRSKFYASSIYCDSDSFKFDDANIVNFGAGDWTIDFWLYIDNTTNQRYGICGNDPTSGNESIRLESNLSPYTLKLVVRNPSDSYLSVTTSNGMTKQAWHHIAIVRNGADVFVYIDGVSGGSVALGAGVALKTPPNVFCFGTTGLNTVNALRNGYFDEIRFSDVARWTANFTPPTSPYWTPDSVTVTSGLVQTYSLASAAQNALEQKYSMLLETALVQRYGDAAVVTAALSQWYGDSSEVLAALVQRYGDAVPVAAALVQRYTLMHSVQTALDQRWSICAAPVTAGLAQVWDLRQRVEVLAALGQYYSMVRSGADISVPSFYVQADGVVIHPSSISWKLSQSSAANSATITLPDKREFDSLQLRGSLDIFFNSVLYQFFIEEKNTAKTVSGDQVTLDYTLECQSLAASLEAPYALPITREYPDTVMASAIVDDLTDGIGVDWQIDDFPVIGGTFFVTDQTPLSAIKSLVGTDTVMAIVQSAPDGTLIIRREVPVDPADWPQTPADHVISDDGDLFADTGDYDITPGYNMIRISSELDASISRRLYQETLTATSREVHGFCVPWQDDFPLQTSGGTWVTIEDCGIITRQIDDEVVEFVDGAASAAYPVYSAVSATWMETGLGSITAAEDGSLQSSIQGNSLASISYQTKYRKWIVHDQQIEQVQCWLDEEAAA